jgi:hypothetical protein
VAAVLEVVEHQRPGRLATDDDAVALPQMLQPRGQRPVGHLDREERELFLVVGAGHAVGAQERTAVHLQADHRELAVAEAEGGVARGREAEQGVGPVTDGQDGFLVERAHESWSRGADVAGRLAREARVRPPGERRAAQTSRRVGGGLRQPITFVYKQLKRGLNAVKSGGRALSRTYRGRAFHGP